VVDAPAADRGPHIHHSGGSFKAVRTPRPRGAWTGPEGNEDGGGWFRRPEMRAWIGEG
jgi:hypothetical protein